MREIAWRLFLFVGLALPLATPARAVEPDEVMPDPALESRARDITAELRCLVCQNQSVDDSHAPLARDLRLLVRERLRAGDSDGDVRRFLVARYGTFVLLKPPVEPATLLLWGAPFAIGGGGLLYLLWPRRRVAAAVAGLSAAEQEELRHLLAKDT